MQRTPRHGTRPSIAGHSALLNPLPRPLQADLIAFARHIAGLKSDYIIFIARKAVRLHDLLLAAGCVFPQSPILTDHVLDQSLVELRGKHVTLVDDTLILGTTLAETEVKLLEADVAGLDKVVFAVDEENWCRTLVSVDRYFVSLGAEEMLNFCAAEVKALSLAAIPYLTDFPVSRSVRLSGNQLEAFNSLPGWGCFSLTTAQQEEAGVHYYSHIPTAEELDRIVALSGGLGPITDIVKVRSFVQGGERAHVARLVPTVTLRPLSEDQVHALFDTHLSRLHWLDASVRQRIALHLTSAKAKLRLLQYFAGLIAGKSLLHSFETAIGRSTPLRFDLEEGVRLFGPWLRGALDQLHGAANQIVRAMPTPTSVAASRPEVLPESVRSIQTDLARFFDPQEPAPQFSPLAALIRVFTQLYRKHELPARKEVHRMGRAVLHAEPEQAPYRDRLKSGFTWAGLVEMLQCQEQDAGQSPSALSLMLDVLVDLGIAVPIIVSRSGMLFRAYRHGEDILFAAREAALAYETAAGFLEGNGRSEIPALTFEKLLVMLLRVGLANKFIDSLLYGTDGSQRVAGIGFYRHGAIATYSDSPVIYAEAEKSYLSWHLVQSEVLERTNQAYVPLRRPEAAVPESGALLHARQLGHLVGMLSRNPGTAKEVILSEKELTLVATCAIPRDAAGAVVAELRVFERWFEQRYDSLLHVDFGDERACADALQALIRSEGYLAFNSASLKLRGYWEGRPSAIIERASEYLRGCGSSGPFLADRWDGFWAPVFAEGAGVSREPFEEALRKLAGEFLTIAIGMFTMELALGSRLMRGTEGGQEYRKACAKILKYLGGLAPLAIEYQQKSKALSRLREVADQQSPMPDPPAAYFYGHATLAGDTAATRNLAKEVGDLVRTYGGMRPRTDFDFYLWYDVIDSLAEKSALAGEAMVEYRNRVARFKSRANSAFLGIKRDAMRAHTLVLVDPPGLETTQDEKNILFARKDAYHWMRETLRITLDLAREHRIGLRIIALNADFAGRAPYVHPESPEVIGLGFWEYGSRVKKWIKVQEAGLIESHQGDGRQSIFWLGDQLASRIEDFPYIQVTGAEQEGTAETSIGNIVVRTFLKGIVLRS